MADRQFPVHPCNSYIIKSVPWDFLAPHEQRAKRNHGQTLERLAERGGLDLSEMLCIVTGQPWGVHSGMKAEVVVGRLMQLLLEWERKRAYHAGYEHCFEKYGGGTLEDHIVDLSYTDWNT